LPSKYPEDNAYRSIARVGKESYSAYAPAKLNITLSIGKREESGYHKLSSIMQTISLHDSITLTKTKPGEEEVLGYFIKENLIEKALEALSAKVGKELHCRIEVAKTIPAAAGLGGGSSDAATVLRLANRAFGLRLGLNELEEAAQEVGNDVSFLLQGGRALVVGGREHRIKQMAVPDLYYVVARPLMELSTKEMYDLHDKTGKSFLELSIGMCPDTKKLLALVKRYNPVESGITGKGPTVFAGYRTYGECRRIAESMTWLDGDVFIARSVEKLI
jgi:4-diphosphocytidyl-2-C-methyl-D-erythritol kinase